MHSETFSACTVSALVQSSMTSLRTCRCKCSSVQSLFGWSGRTLERFGYRLPLKVTALMAGGLVFCLSAMYEIIELWDEVYFGGKRIWGPYDTATDLQWDLCGIIIGTLFAAIILRRSPRKVFVS